MSIPVICLSVFAQSAQPTPTGAGRLNQWRLSRMPMLIGTTSANWRAAGTPTPHSSRSRPGENRLVFFGDSITDIWHLDEYLPGEHREFCLKTYNYGLPRESHLRVQPMRHVAVMVWVLMLAVASLGQQLTQRMTDQDVIDMVSAGLADDVVIAKINATEATDFDISLEGLKKLKLGKVSDAVIRVMIHITINQPENPAGAGNSAAASPTAGNVGPPEEAGVYAVLKGKPTEIEPEVVNWQAGGVAKSRATLFILKGDLNGKVMKPASPTRLKDPVEFLIKTIAGASATEYQLLRLHQKGDQREFRSVTGGVLHQSGGAQRDEVSFQPEKIGNGLWKVRLDSLEAGEYGFLAPANSSGSIAAAGKIYTFGVLEGDPLTTMWNVSQASQDERKVDARTGSNGIVSTQEFNDATIGAATDESPKVRHDGITLSRVTPGGPAEQAGIRVGDAILAIDDHYLFTAEELDSEIKHHKPGTRIAVRYRRYSTIYSTYLTVGAVR